VLAAPRLAPEEQAAAAEARAVALAGLAAVFRDPAVQGDFDPTGASPADPFAARVERAFAERCGGAWALSGLAQELVFARSAGEGGRGGRTEGEPRVEGVEGPARGSVSDLRVAAAAARFVGVRGDRLAEARLGRFLRALEVAAVDGAPPHGESVGAAQDELQLAHAAAQALAERGAFGTLAASFDALAARGLVAPLIASWTAAGRGDDVAALEAALPRSYVPAAPSGWQGLDALGAPGHGRMARLVLEGCDAQEPLVFLAAAPGGAEAVARALDGERRLRGARLERAAGLIAATRAVDCMELLVEAGRRGERRALAALVALPGVAPLQALLELEHEGLLRDASPWAVAATADASRLAVFVDTLVRRDVDGARALVARLVEADVSSALPALVVARGGRRPRRAHGGARRARRRDRARRRPCCRRRIAPAAARARARRWLARWSAGHTDRHAGGVARRDACGGRRAVARRHAADQRRGGPRRARACGCARRQRHGAPGAGRTIHRRRARHGRREEEDLRLEGAQMITTLCCLALLQADAISPLSAPRPQAASSGVGSAEPIARPRAAASGAAPVEQDVVRVYDLRVLGLAPRTDEHLGDFAVLPAGEIGSDGNAEAEAPSPIGDAAWIDLFVDLLDPALQGEGSAAVVTEEGMLRVTGPPALHASASGLLDLLGGIAGHDVRLAIDFLPLRRGDDGDARGPRVHGPAMVPLAEVEELLKDRTASYEVSLPAGTGAFSSLREQRVTVDLAVEVASGAAIADPITLGLLSGTRIAARAAPASGGVHLTFVAKRSTLEVGKRETAITSHTRHVGEDGRAFTASSLALRDDPSWRTSVVGTSVFLPDGYAFVCHTTGGGSGQMMVVRSVGEPWLPTRTARFDDGTALAFVHRGALAPPELAVWGRLLDAGTGPLEAYEVGSLGGGFDLACRPKPANLDSPREALMDSIGPDLDNWEVGPWLVARGAESELRSEVLLPQAEPALVVRVSTAARGSVRSEVFPVRIGTHAVVSSTREFVDFVDHDAEIAERSSCTDPRGILLFDGLALQLRVLRKGPNELVLETAGAYCDLGPRRSDVLSGELGLVIEARDSQYLDLRGRRVLTPDGQGKYTATYGDLHAMKDGAGQGEGPVVVIELLTQ
jgi:hypothetical protein